MEFYVNGQRQFVQNPQPELTLLQYLRSIGLTGTKLGCAEGGCGACTVLVSSYSPVTGQIKHLSVNACLAPLCSMHGKHVITVEGIGSSKNPHPVQERIAKLFGSQCGFCTPGIVMALYAFLRNHPEPTDHEIEEAFDGNLCRCTGYRPILDAAKSFSCSGCSPENGGCCKQQKSGATEGADESVGIRFGPNTIQVKKYDPSQELIFPPTLQRKLQNEKPEMLHFKSDHCEWYRPVSLAQLLDLKSRHPSSKIVNGNTEVGIETKFKNLHYPMFIYPMDIDVLQQVHRHEHGIEFGGCLTLTDFKKSLSDAVRDLPEHKTRTFRALLENLRWFAGTQIRNVATIGGNIVTASPISDLNPIFVASGSKLTVIRKSSSGSEEKRVIPMGEFFLGYRKTALLPDEVVYSITVPFTEEFEFVEAFKQAKRRDDDIAIVTSGMRVKLQRDNDAWVVQDCCFGYGGMGPTTVMAKCTRELCVGKLWDRELVTKVIDLLTNSDLLLSASAPGGMVEFRRSLASSFFFKFFLLVTDKIAPHQINEREKTALDGKTRPVSKGLQVFIDNTKNITVGKTETHMSALKQVTGEALYTDDIPKQARELYAGLVMSSKAHARIKSVDTSRALEMPGVVSYISHKDVPHHNMIGPVFKDEEVLASDFVYFHGQIIGLILAENQMQAQAAAKLVKVEYEELKPILTIEDAIEANSFYPITKTMKRGDAEMGLKESDHIVEGEIRIGGQEHFYLETQASLVIPKGEDDEIEVWASTQNPTETQHLVAHVLGIPSNRVVCRVKRMGGGFGGKETRSAPLSCALAVAAHQLKRPVRCMLDRDEDMILSGQRHPFLGRYKVGFKKDGKLHALQIQLFSNAGYSADLSIAVMERAVAHSDNCYFIPHVHVYGRVCKTNIHSNTAYRGFGGPQGMIITESWMNHVAEHLGISVDILREKNLYKEGEKTHFNQVLDNYYIPRLWKEIKESSELVKRRQEVDAFNKANQWKKRGLAIIPTKFGIAFTARFLNQAGALVHIYTDGSVLLSHGGTEMGQGLHTKCAQICADALGIPLSQVHISETATDKVANTSPTAASASSDLNGMATLVACQEISERLRPYREKNPNATFAEIVLTAYRDRVNLSANGYYKTPDLSYDWDKNEGRLFNYYTFGVAVSEVEVDLLTGDFQMLRSDVIMDLGKSLNPGIDIGQIEGAFVQGAGWSTIEETVFFPSGQLFSRGPGNYKIPGFTDIPIDFRVSLLSEAENPRAVHSSKAVGEPPFFLGASVYLAVRDAIRASRLENGLNGYFRFDLPATAERIRMACMDPMSQAARSIPRNPGEKDWCIRV